MAKIKPKTLAVYAGTILILSLLFLATIRTAADQGWKFPGIGNVSFSGNQSTFKLPNGTVIDTAVIPVGLSFKMSIVSFYSDNTQETIFEKSNLPSFSAITVHGKPIRNVTSATVVAVRVSDSLPATATATFTLNFTATIEQENGTVYTKWRSRTVTSPFIVGGTLSMVVMPALTVLPNEVFPKLPSKSQDQRLVTWVISTIVQIEAPGFSFLPLRGSSTSAAQISFNGDITGCTNCPTTGSPSGSQIVGGVKLDVETGPPEPKPPGPGPADPVIVSVDGSVFSVGQVYHVGVISTGALKEICTGAGCSEKPKPEPQKITNDFVGSGNPDTAGGVPGGGLGRYAINEIPIAWRLPIGSSVYAVNPYFIALLLGIFVTLAAAMLFLLLRGKKKKKK